MRARLRTVIAGAITVVVLPALVFGGAPAAWSVKPPEPIPAPGIIEGGDVAVPPPLGLSTGLEGATGTVEVTVRLAEPTIAQSVEEGALAEGKAPGKAAQKAKKDKVTAQQDQFLADAKDLGRTSWGAGSRCEPRRRLDRRRAAAGDRCAGQCHLGDADRTYEMHATTLDEAVQSGSLGQAIDYVQARPLHDAGFDGTGVRSPCWTRASTSPTSTSADPAIRRPPMNASRAPPRRPACAQRSSAERAQGQGRVRLRRRDLGRPALAWPTRTRSTRAGSGHGTHVADIIGGRSTDGTHQGIAPGVDLYAVKVCSSVSHPATASHAARHGLGARPERRRRHLGCCRCGQHVARLVVWTGAGRLRTGGGQPRHAGVVVVVSAGNSADRPFIVGSPSSHPARSASLRRRCRTTCSGSSRRASARPSRTPSMQSWSPTPVAAITAALARPAGGLGCVPRDFAALPRGCVALVPRGSAMCPTSRCSPRMRGGRRHHLQQRTGDPPSFSFGDRDGDRPDAQHLAG